MQITVSGKQVDLSDALRTRVAQQLDSIAGKYFDHALEAHVTFSRARSFFTCDINVHAGRGLMLRGEGEAADAQWRVRRRRRAHRQAAAPLPAPGQRTRARRRQHGAAAVGAAVCAAAGGAGGRRPRSRRRWRPATYATVVAETQAEIVSLSCRDAVMRMDLADQPVLMFRNSATRRAECGLPPQRRPYRLDRSHRPVGRMREARSAASRD